MGRVRGVDLLPGCWVDSLLLLLLLLLMHPFTCPSRGAAGNLVAFLYYGAPLSTMLEVIKTKNSASILLPLTVMNVINAALWTTYGFVSHTGGGEFCACGPHTAMGGIRVELSPVTGDWGWGGVEPCHPPQCAPSASSHDT